MSRWQPDAMRRRQPDACKTTCALRGHIQQSTMDYWCMLAGAVPLGTLALETHAFCRPTSLQTPAQRGMIVTLHLGCTMLHLPIMSHWLISINKLMAVG